MIRRSFVICDESYPLQLGAELPRRDSRWICRRSFTRSLAGGALDIFFYDTNPFVQYYYNRSWAGNAGAIRGLNSKTLNQLLNEADHAVH